MKVVNLFADTREAGDAATGFDRTLVLWRSETISATLRFLEAMRTDAQDVASRAALAARSRRPA
jgi:hypothetical protein